MFCVEGNSKWAKKFNKQIMRCHEKIETNFRTNQDQTQGEEDIENLIAHIVEKIEVVHDFEGEI